MNRLEQLSAELSEWGKTLSDANRKKNALKIAEQACDITGVWTGIDVWSRKTPFIINTSADANQIKLIRKFQEETDKEYLDLSEKSEYFGDRNLKNTALLFFFRARAIASYLYALNAESYESFCESLYEASAASNDMPHFLIFCTALSRKIQRRHSD